jgi:ribosome-associated heat shock protein Hsp15
MSDGERMRLDVFLWRVRLFKTRSAAAEAVEAGVRVERDGLVRRIDKPATPAAAGDLVSLGLARGQGVLRILALPERRGPASEAALCYEWVTTP